jgi:hypothetical protein
VLELGQGLRFVIVEAGDLQDDGPVGEVMLLGKEDAGESTAAQFLPELEAEQAIAGSRQEREALVRGTPLDRGRTPWFWVARGTFGWLG